MWDQRYARDGFAYGSEPNDFLRESAPLLGSPVLCLASGEGRNAVWLAEQGLQVHAVDGSAVGVAKTLSHAQARGVTVEATHADLSDFELGEGWGGIIAIFAHLPQPLRATVHRRVVDALRPGGVFLMEAYTPRQLALGTGGPPTEQMLYEPGTIREELEGLRLERLEELERDVVEGRYHAGRSAVLQVIARRP